MLLTLSIIWHTLLLFLRLLCPLESDVREQFANSRYKIDASYCAIKYCTTEELILIIASGPRSSRSAKGQDNEYILADETCLTTLLIPSSSSSSSFFPLLLHVLSGQRSLALASSMTSCLSLSRSLARFPFFCPFRNNRKSAGRESEDPPAVYINCPMAHREYQTHLRSLLSHHQILYTLRTHTHHTTWSLSWVVFIIIVPCYSLYFMHAIPCSQYCRNFRAFSCQTIAIAHITPHHTTTPIPVSY